MYQRVLFDLYETVSYIPSLFVYLFLPFLFILLLLLSILLCVIFSVVGYG